MSFPLPPDDELDFFRRVDELGAAGKSQDEIAAELGLTRHQIRHRLQKRGYDWSAETRVRTISGQRLEDLLRSLQPEKVAA